VRYALIFPGQGAQRPGMCKDFYDEYDASRRAFEEADEALGFSLSDIIFNGTQADLTKTEITQPAILTASIAAFRAVEAEFGAKLKPVCVAGHSLGEYTALVATGAVSLADGVRLVHLRGRLMQDAVPLGIGSMAAIVGKGLDEVSAACDEAAKGEVCEAANVNAPAQIVVSGHASAVERASAILTAAGAKVVPLRVSAPFHCKLMRPVGEELKDAFAKIEWHEPECPIAANASAKLIKNVDELKEALYRQTFSPVLWSQSVLAMEAYGTDGYIEMGPGSVLSGLVRKICNGKRPYPVSDKEGLALAVKFLRGEA